MQKIKLLRIENGFTQRQLAQIIGISQRSISNYELGQREVPIAILMKIAIVLDTTVDEIIEFRKIHDEIGQDLLEKTLKIKEPKS